MQSVVLSVVGGQGCVMDRIEGEEGEVKKREEKLNESSWTSA